MRLAYKETYFDDLEDIAEYIATCFNSDLAINIMRGIHADCRLIAEQPYLGRVYPRNPYFHCRNVLRKNIVFYHIDEKEQTVTLHRIFDPRRDYAVAVESVFL